MEGNGIQSSSYSGDVSLTIPKKTVVAKTDLDHSHSTVNSELTQSQTYAVIGAANSADTTSSLHLSTYSERSTKPDGQVTGTKGLGHSESVSERQALQRHQSPESSVSLHDRPQEAIADWDPFFSVDDITHDDELKRKERHSDDDVHVRNEGECDSG